MSGLVQNMSSVVVFFILWCVSAGIYGLQFPWAAPKEGVTDSPLSIWELRKPDFPVEKVQEFLNETVAGVDYPNFLTIPVTNFTCKTVEQPGFYADPETGCQVYHRCDQTGQMFSFLCGNQTIFDQLLLTCDFFYKVNCPLAKQFFNYANVNLYSKQPLLRDNPPHNPPGQQTGQL